MNDPEKNKKMKEKVELLKQKLLKKNASPQSAGEPKDAIKTILEKKDLLQQK